MVGLIPRFDGACTCPAVKETCFPNPNVDLSMVAPQLRNGMKVSAGR